MDNRDQDNVWDYYQTEGLSIFGYAVPRLDYLFKLAQSVTKDRQKNSAPFSVLNIGTGNGFLETRCHHSGWESWGLDPNLQAIKELMSTGVHGVVAGIERIPLLDGKFDIVFSSEVFEHLFDDLLAAGLKEIARILKPGGNLIGTVPCREKLEMHQVVCPECSHVHHAYGHHQSFDTARLNRLFHEAGLKPVFFRIRAFPGFKRRSFKGKLKSLVWYALGRFGAEAADAKIIFLARKA